MNRLIPALLLLSGCAVGPDYTRPELKAPHKWSGLPTAEQSTSDQKTWWESFDDQLLRDLIREALIANKDLSIAKARLREARAYMAGTESSLFPSVFAHASSERDINIIPVIPLTKPYNVLMASFDAVWEVDLFSGTRREIEASQAQEDAVAFGLQEAQLSLIAEVARTYAEYCKLKSQVTILSKSTQVQKERSQLQHKRTTLGESPKQTSLAATRAEEQLSAKLAATQAGLQAAQHSLEVLLGLQPQMLSTKLAAANGIPKVVRLDGLAAPAAMLRARPDIQIAERELAAATAEKGVAIADLYPKISLSAFIGRASMTRHNFKSRRNKSQQVYGEINLPLFNFGRQMALVEAADARMEEALLNFENAALKALAEVESFAAAYDKSTAQLEHITTSHLAAEQALSLADKSLEVGEISGVQHMDIALQTHESALQLADAQADAVTRFIGLQKALGGGIPTSRSETSKK